MLEYKFFVLVNKACLQDQSPCSSKQYLKNYRLRPRPHRREKQKKKFFEKKRIFFSRGFYTPLYRSQYFRYCTRFFCYRARFFCYRSRFFYYRCRYVCYRPHFVCYRLRFFYYRCRFFAVAVALSARYMLLPSLFCDRPVSFTFAIACFPLAVIFAFAAPLKSLLSSSSQSRFLPHILKRIPIYKV